MWLELGAILSSGLGSIWYGLMWFCRYLDDFGYSITIIAFGIHTLFSTEQTWGKLIVNANALLMHSFFPVIQGND